MKADGNSGLIKISVSRIKGDLRTVLKKRGRTLVGMLVGHCAGLPPLVSQMSLQLRNLTVTQGRIEYENLPDLHSAEGRDAIPVTGPDYQIAGSCGNRITVIDVVFFVSIGPLSPLEGAFPHGPYVNLSIDRGSPALTSVSCRAPDRKSREVRIVLSELPTDSVFPPLGEYGSPVGQSIPFGNDENRGILPKVKNGRIGDPQVLSLPVEGKSGQPIPPVDAQIRSFPISCMPACAGLVPPLVKHSAKWFIG